MAVFARKKTHQEAPSAPVVEASEETVVVAEGSVAAEVETITVEQYVAACAVETGVEASAPEPVVAEATATGTALVVQEPVAPAPVPAVAVTTVRTLSPRTIKGWGKGAKDKEKVLLPNRDRIPDDWTITVQVKGTNPKRRISAMRFAKYVDGMTVAQYIKACDRLTVERVSRADILWDINHGFISVSAPMVVEGEVGQEMKQIAAA